MIAIPIVGKCFNTPKDFLAYLDGVTFGAWRPRFVTAHHTGSPDLKVWNGWQKRAVPVTDEQWLKNLAAYYGNEMGWSAGPHFFFTPAHYCVLTPPDRRGVHAVSFNALSWGVEMVGDFDSERLEGVLRDRYVAGLACLYIATGLKVSPYIFQQQGLHFHRDDPKTSKTCPGRSIDKAILIREIELKIASMTGGDAPAEQVAATVHPIAAKQTGRVNTNDLSVRAGASAKTPVLGTIDKGATVTILGETMNGDTKWLNIAPGEWVAARFVDIATKGS